MDLMNLRSEVLDSVTVTATPEQIGAVLERIAVAREQLAELRGLCESAMTEWVRQNGELLIGDVRWYLAVERETKCIDRPGTLIALIEAEAGDVAAMDQYLSASAFKHGAIRARLAPELYARLFRAEEVEKLKEGKPTKKLLSVNERFTRRPTDTAPLARREE